MSLYLVQHGKTLPKEKDPSQSLTEEGISDVERMSELAREYGVQVSIIKHSGKKRAQQTAAIMGTCFKPSEGIQECEGLNPLDEVKPFAEKLTNETKMMLVGHLPFMQKLVSYLITGKEEIPVIRFQNGGIICLDQLEESKNWFIKWTLLPCID